MINLYKNTLLADMNTIEKTISSEEIVEAFQQLSPGLKSLVRNVVRMDLQSMSYEEIGSSDVSCRVVQLYKQLGSFDAIISYGLDMFQA